MSRVLLIAACCAGCGRIDFGSHPDGGVTANDGADTTMAIGHDEDGDGRPDTSDPCPFTSDDGTDSDGDGVGDACDPHPSIGGDMITVFSPLEPGTSPFESIAGWTEDADGISIAGDSALTLTHPFANSRIEIGWVIHALVGTGQHQIAGGIEGTTPYYFSELNDNPPRKNVSVVSYDVVNGYVELDGVTHNGVHPGTGILRIDATATPAPSVHVRTGWIGELYDAMASTPAYAGGNTIHFAINGVDVTIEYIAVIDSP